MGLHATGATPAINPNPNPVPQKPQGTPLHRLAPPLAPGPTSPIPPLPSAPLSPVPRGEHEVQRVQPRVAHRHPAPVVQRVLPQTRVGVLQREEHRQQHAQQQPLQQAAQQAVQGGAWGGGRETEWCQRKTGLDTVCGIRSNTCEECRHEPCFVVGQVGQAGRVGMGV